MVIFYYALLLLLLLRCCFFPHNQLRHVPALLPHLLLHLLLLLLLYTWYGTAVAALSRSPAGCTPRQPVASTYQVYMDIRHTRDQLARGWETRVYYVALDNYLHLFPFFYPSPFPLRLFRSPFACLSFFLLKPSLFGREAPRYTSMLAGCREQPLS